MANTVANCLVDNFLHISDMHLVVMIATVFFFLIGLFCFFSYKTYYEDANQNSKECKSKELQESTKSYKLDKSTEPNPNKDIHYIRPYPINGFDINLRSINGFSKSSWVWNLVLAKIVCESIEIMNGTRERVIYARIYYFYDGRQLPARGFVSCKLINYLRDTTIQSSDLMLLEFNEINKSYKIFRIFRAYDSI